MQVLSEERGEVEPLEHCGILAHGRDHLKHAATSPNLYGSPLQCDFATPLIERWCLFLYLFESGLSMGLLWPVNAVEVIYSHPSMSMGIGSRTPPQIPKCEDAQFPMSAFCICGCGGPTPV